VLENFKAGALAKYGLGYQDLGTINPALIYCSITGFGQSGPRRDQAAYDFMIQGMSGLMSVTGEADGKPGAGPQSRRAHRRHHDRDVRRDCRSGRAGAAAGERPG
jgi:crotonobetainyl-CoA:carnitine CoA-transferase CaiB-like acyl-CoA transferase